MCKWLTRIFPFLLIVIGGCLLPGCQFLRSLPLFGGGGDETTIIVGPGTGEALDAYGELIDEFLQALVREGKEAVQDSPELRRAIIEIAKSVAEEDPEVWLYLCGGSE